MVLYLPAFYRKLQEINRLREQGASKAEIRQATSQLGTLKGTGSTSQTVATALVQSTAPVQETTTEPTYSAEIGKGFTQTDANTSVQTKSYQLQMSSGYAQKLQTAQAEIKAREELRRQQQLRLSKTSGTLSLSQKPTRYQSFKGSFESANIYAQDTSKPYIKRVGAGIWGFVGGVAVQPALGAGEFIKSAVTKPKETFISVKESTTEFIKNPTYYTGQIGEWAYKNPASASGAIAGTVLAPIVISKTGTGVRNVYVKTGSQYVAPEKVFAGEVLSGESRFPTSSNVGQSFKEFQNVRVGTHTTGEAYSRTTSIKAGGRATAGLEDTGLYISPKSRGSPYFLGVEDAGYYSETVSLNPFKGAFKTPTVVNVAYKNIKRMPESLIRSKGFSDVNVYLQKQAGTGSAFITKRSEIGLRGLKGLGQGTVETEAVIPTGTKISSTPKSSFLGKVKGYEQYTTYKGVNVPIREYKVVVGETVTPKAFKATAGEIKEYGSYTGSSRKITPSYSKFLSGYSSGYAPKSYSSAIYESSYKPISSYKPVGYSSVSSYKSSSSLKYFGKSYGGGSSGGSYGGSSGIGYSGGSYGGGSSGGGTSILRSPPKITIPAFGRVGGKQKSIFKKQKVTQPKQYTPTAFSAGLGIRGRASKIGTVSGLGFRPIRTKRGKLY